MTTLGRKMANQENAQASTGPTSAEGKAASAQNAITHGLLAKRAVIKGEDPAEFAAFKEKLWQEWAPVGTEEMALAEQLAILHWKQQRAERLEVELWDQLPEAAPADGKDGADAEASATPLADQFRRQSKTFNQFMRYAGQNARQLDRAREALRKLQAARKQATFDEALLRETKIVTVQLMNALGFHQTTAANPGGPPQWILAPQKVRDWAAYHARQKAERRTG